MKRKIFGIIAACTVLISSMASSSANGVENNVFTYGDNRIVVIEDMGIDSDKMQSIADFVAEEGDGVSACGILCIFGHSLATTKATETTHNVYTSSPKCVKKTYDVEYCTRSSCDYMVKELYESKRISTCHG